MKKLRKHSPAISLFLGSLLLFISCAKEPAIRPANKTQLASAARSVVNTQQAGQNLFKGLYFMQGSIAEKLPSIKNSQTYYLVNKATNPELNSKIAQVIKAIDANDPTYFDRFYTQMSSGTMYSFKRS